MRTIAGGLLLWCLMSATRGAESPEAVVRAFSLAIQTDGVAPTVTQFTHPDEAARSVDGSKFDPPQFLGSVREGDVAHLIVRTELTARIKRMDVISLKPLGETWKFMISSEMEQQALTLAAQ